MKPTRYNFIPLALLSGIAILALAYVVEQNALVGDRGKLTEHKNTMKELNVMHQVHLSRLAFTHLESQFESFHKTLRLERVKEFTFLERSPSELSSTPKHYE